MEKGLKGMSEGKAGWREGRIMGEEGGKREGGISGRKTGEG